MTDRSIQTLTAAQQRMLDEVQQYGVKVYKGGARRTAEALEASGLVSIDYDHVAQTKGGGIELVQRITVRATDPVEHDCHYRDALERVYAVLSASRIGRAGTEARGIAMDALGRLASWKQEDES